MRLLRLIPSALASLYLVACASSPPPAGPAQPAAPAISPAEAIVQRQLDAYNAHDLDGFLATYAPDAELFDLPGAATPTTSGHDEMRGIYGGIFAQLPDLRCDIANRIVSGAYVVDHEICTTGIAGEPEMRAIAIYQVENNLIRRVWFGLPE